MSQVFKGDVTNNVVELNLQAGATNIGTPTVAYDGAVNGEIAVQVMGDVDGFSGFENDLALKGLVIGTSCTSIGDSAFGGCTNLAGSLMIPDSVTSIGNYAFQDAEGSTRVIPDSVTSIGNYAFAYNFTSTKDYVGCPASSFTGSNAFYGCDALNTLYAKDAVANGYTLGAQTFQGKSLTIANWDNYPIPIPN